MLGYVLKGKHQQGITETKHTELKLFTPILLAINAGLKQNTALNFIHKQTTLTSQYIDYFLKGKKRKTFSLVQLGRLLNVKIKKMEKWSRNIFIVNISSQPHN